MGATLAAGVAAVAACGATTNRPSTPAMQVAFTQLWQPIAPWAERLAGEKGCGMGAVLERDVVGGVALPPAVAPAQAVAAHAAKPPRVDMRAKCPPVYNQGPFFSCTAFAVVKGLGEYLLRRKGDRTPLSAAHFYAATEQAGMVSQWIVQHSTVNSGMSYVALDAGAPIALAMAAFELGGAVREADRPYPPSAEWPAYVQRRSGWPRTPIRDAAAPAFPALERYFKLGSWSIASGSGVVSYGAVATKLRITAARRVPTLAAMKSSLAAGMPVVAGFALRESFYGAGVSPTGHVALPGADERVAGGHAMLIVGYDDAAQELIVRNSWGATWGDQGYCYWPYAAVTQGLVTDGWTVAEE